MLDRETSVIIDSVIALIRVTLENVFDTVQFREVVLDHCSSSASVCILDVFVGDFDVVCLGSVSLCVY